MKRRTAEHLAAVLYLIGLLALASSLYLLGIDNLNLGTYIAIVGIVLAGITFGLLIWYV